MYLTLFTFLNKIKYGILVLCGLHYVAHHHMQPITSFYIF